MNSPTNATALDDRVRKHIEIFFGRLEDCRMQYFSELTGQIIGNQKLQRSADYSIGFA